MKIPFFHFLLFCFPFFTGLHQLVLLFLLYLQSFPIRNKQLLLLCQRISFCLKLPLQFLHFLLPHLFLVVIYRQMFFMGSELFPI